MDPAGIRHAAEVSAESLFEAVVLGIRAISEEWAEEPALGTKIEVEVAAPAVTHEVTFRQLRDWLNSTCSSPKARLTRERLKSLLAS
ncbi:MAG TPA: hypothetical protein VFL57_17820 [Bryobacteraceae bacterium]|nr:hypothetical protein [Bryobacteraceae bacterium]